ncbi:hypothetical protein GQ53DRAFT_652346 [Thozetella sp. PMI_491]|nr:hypothetical protein GQ53DRAFT_652346 [Thozetella sp. PMI_491]
MCTPEPQRDAVEQLKKQSNSHLSTKIVLDPPNLMQWRQRLFDLEEIVIMNHDEFETYFPHVDNIYSHRSTQRYKRKPFVTHYWDCRMKGRPPGTPKSDDPNKKKRKRNARERDLCDVKIKITEYSAGPSISELMLASNLGGDVLARVHGHPFWTLQRVNGNGTNGTGDGKPATHKHTLDKSDEIKRNSIQRLVAARDKTTKKPQKPSAALAAATMPAWSQGARKPTGAAASTARKHAKAHEMKLYSACFCPFSQRVWIALEAKGLAYQYCEMDPFSSPKPTHLLEANPRGQVPAIRHGEWACGESTVILEYLEDLDDTVVLYPTDPRLKATCRLWVEFINTTVVPAFYGLLKATEQPARGEAAKILQHHINSIVQAADEKGPYFLGHQMCLVDIHFAPFALRLLRIIDPFRSWIPSLPDPRLHRWIMAMEDNPHVRNTMSSNNLYINTLDLLVQGAKP